MLLFHSLQHFDNCQQSITQPNFYEERWDEILVDIKMLNVKVWNVFVNFFHFFHNHSFLSIILLLNLYLEEGKLNCGIEIESKFKYSLKF